MSNQHPTQSSSKAPGEKELLQAMYAFPAMYESLKSWSRTRGQTLKRLNNTFTKFRGVS